MKCKFCSILEVLQEVIIFALISFLIPSVLLGLFTQEVLLDEGFRTCSIDLGPFDVHFAKVLLQVGCIGCHFHGFDLDAGVETLLHPNLVDSLHCGVDDCLSKLVLGEFADWLLLQLCLTYRIEVDLTSLAVLVGEHAHSWLVLALWQVAHVLG